MLFVVQLESFGFTCWLEKRNGSHEHTKYAKKTVWANVSQQMIWSQFCEDKPRVKRSKDLNPLLCDRDAIAVWMRTLDMEFQIPNFKKPLVNLIFSKIFPGATNRIVQRSSRSSAKHHRPVTSWRHHRQATRAVPFEASGWGLAMAELWHHFFWGMMMMMMMMMIFHF